MTKAEKEEQIQFAKDSIAIVSTLLQLISIAGPAVELACETLLARLNNNLQPFANTLSNFDEKSALICYERLKKWQHDKDKIFGYFDKYTHGFKFAAEKPAEKGTSASKKKTTRKKPGNKRT